MQLPIFYCACWVHILLVVGHATNMTHTNTNNGMKARFGPSAAFPRAFNAYNAHRHRPLSDQCVINFHDMLSAPQSRLDRDPGCLVFAIAPRRCIFNYMAKNRNRQAASARSCSALYNPSLLACYNTNGNRLIEQNNHYIRFEDTIAVFC